MMIENFVDYAMKTGASYADARIVNRSAEISSVWDGNIEEQIHNRSYGYGIRILFNGAWGFAASNDFSKWKEVVLSALKVAQASLKRQREPVCLAPVPVIRDHYQTYQKIDVRTISLNERLDLLLEADHSMSSVSGITQRKSTMGIYSTDILFASSEGSLIEQNLIACGAGTVAYASNGSDTAFRSYPASFQGDYSSAGYEHILGLNLIEGSKRFAQQAVELLSAKQCTSGKKTIILDSSMLTLMVHESIGHALESDRVLGSEASYAGTSFATPEKLADYHYGSEQVTITSDPTLPGGLASYGYDDEGYPACRTVLIDRGILIHYLTSRETAEKLKLPLTAAMRADGWQRFPLIRITNVNLEPGDSSLAKMISEVDDGIYMETVKTYSIDDKRLNFQFAPEISWEIKNGKIGSMVKNVRYSGMTPEFWNSCDAVANRDEWHLWGIPVCGKGEPSQVVMVGHGTAPARFQNVSILGD